MRPPKHARLTAAVAASALLGVAGCSSTGESSKKPTRTTVPATTVPATTVPVTTVPAAAATIPEVTEPVVSAVTHDVLAALLMSPADIGPSFVATEYPGPSSATPCGVAVDAQVPYAAQAGVVATSALLELRLLEEIRGYSTTAEAERAYTTGVDGLSCAGANGITFGQSHDVSAQLGVPAVAIEFTTAQLEGVIVIAQVGNALVSFQFEGLPGAAAAANAPDPLTLAAAGIARVTAFTTG